MPHYIKSCVVCFKQFYTYRIGQMYCSGKCKNQSRKYPAKILQAMMDKASKGTQVIDTVPKAVREWVLKNKDMEVLGNVDVSKLPEDLQIAEKLKYSSIPLVDQKAIVSEVMKLKRDREVKSLEAQFTKEDKEDQKGDNSFDGELRRNKDLDALQGFVDPEMVDLDLDKIDEEVRDNLKFINTSDPANANAEGFNDSKDNKSVGHEAIRTNNINGNGNSHKGIRKIGGK